VTLKALSYWGSAWSDCSSLASWPQKISKDLNHLYIYSLKLFHQSSLWMITMGFLWSFSAVQQILAFTMTVLHGYIVTVEIVVI
jgi:hypothetical protein